MVSKVFILAALIAYVEARFGQEQIPIQAISQVQGGPPGLAPTIAGGAISNLLAAASPCDKLKTADRIVAELGGGADALAAAIGLVAAEQNFNPFVIDRPTICNDPSLPATAALRGILPLVDPAVTNAGLANQLSATSRTTPFNADGLSVAQVLAAQGFTVFNTKDAANANGPTGDELAGGAAAPPPPPAEDDQEDAPPAEQPTEAPEEADGECPATITSVVTVTADAPQATAPPPPPPAQPAPPAPPAGNAPGSTIGGLDFGKCSPAIKFEGGLGGRPATEFTFQAIDPLVALGQQEALNPAIIVNRVCDQLTNVCEANQAAKDACRAAQAAVDSTQRNAQTAIAFNTALGFADAFVEGAAPPAANPANPVNVPADNFPGVQKSTIAGLDFGKCVPTMKFVGGLGNRPATEFTFQAIDPIVALGQQEALNPAIIVNRICDQLTNVCEANQAAKDACRAAQAAVDSTQRNAQTAVAFNTALGFANADVNRRSEEYFRRRAVEGIKKRSARFAY